jgi:hypothetical protein
MRALLKGPRHHVQDQSGNAEVSVMTGTVLQVKLLQVQRACHR